MSPVNKKLVIFDFDGVLVNTIEFSFVIHKKDNPNFTWNKFQDFSNGNFMDGMKKAVDEKLHNIPSNFKERYKEEIEKINIHSTLSESVLFLSHNYTVAIVSSTYSDLINNFLIKENLRNCFSDILGVDVNKSKILKIRSLIQKYNMAPKDIVFITDSLGDILEANDCGVSSIGVTWGIHERENLEKGNPIAVIDDPRELITVIKNVLK